MNTPHSDSDLNEQKTVAILSDIIALNKRKQAIALELDLLQGKLCEVSARIGEKQAELKNMNIVHPN